MNSRRKEDEKKDKAGEFTGHLNKQPPFWKRRATGGF